MTRFKPLLLSILLLPMVAGAGCNLSAKDIVSKMKHVGTGPREVPSIEIEQCLQVEADVFTSVWVSNTARWLVSIGDTNTKGQTVSYYVSPKKAGAHGALELIAKDGNTYVLSIKAPI